MTIVDRHCGVARCEVFSLCVEVRERYQCIHDARVLLLISSNIGMRNNCVVHLW
jgi:hypothetical protein